jgi:hypothetical protein
MIYMTVIIQIHYRVIEVDIRVYRKGAFQLKGKKREEVAHEFWRWIKRQRSLEVELEKVICEDKDITELVRKLEKAPLD